MKPIYAIMKYCELPMWTTAQQWTDGASYEESEHNSCPNGDTDGGKDQQGNMHAKSTQNETARQSTEPNASIDPSNDTDDKPEGGRPEYGKSDDKLQCQPIDTQTGLYMEKQLRKFCQVHALNAFFGRNIVQPHTMLTFCKAEIDRDTFLDKAFQNKA